MKKRKRLLAKEFPPKALPIKAYPPKEFPPKALPLKAHPPKELPPKALPIKELSIQERRRLQAWLRALIQLSCFIFFPSAFTAAFAGVKYIITQIGAGEQIAWTPFVAALVALCAVTILFGRFFCGFACAFGSLGDVLHSLYLFLCRKCGKKPWKVPPAWQKWLPAVPYLVLAAIVLLCFAGIWGRMSAASPWETFSMLRAGNFGLEGHLAGLCLLGILALGMCVEERFFCRFFCPMGAVFSLLPTLPLCSLGRDRERCIPGCSACSRNCPAKIELPESGKGETSYRCIQCQKCVNVCPKGNIHSSFRRIKGNEIIIILVKTAILIGMFLWLGI